MSEKPILFSAPMVRAILEGRKTQTRRIIVPDSVAGLKEGDIFVRWPAHEFFGQCAHFRPPIKVGDTLWVREAHTFVGSCDPGFILYRASDYFEQCEAYGFDKPIPPIETIKWKPSIFLHREFSRILLKVTDVKVERLQEISGDDAIAEGVERDSDGWFDYEFPSTQCCVSALESFKTLWTSINGKASWEANPWVVAYSFERIKP